jgi:hypothetical protein
MHSYQQGAAFNIGSGTYQNEKKLILLEFSTNYFIKPDTKRRSTNVT